jgi:hypothetical protein
MKFSFILQTFSIVKQKKFYEKKKSQTHSIEINIQSHTHTHKQVNRLDEFAFFIIFFNQTNINI